MNFLSKPRTVKRLIACGRMAMRDVAVSVLLLAIGLILLSAATWRR
jgi:hypothetical protein